MDNYFLALALTQPQGLQTNLSEQLNAIRKMPASKTAKIQMVEGLMAAIRQKQQLERQKMRENLSTSFSENRSNFTYEEHQLEELEERILDKRVQKFQLNEEIQGMEEDLFQIEKTVDTKIKYDEQLRKSLENKMWEVEKTAEERGDKSYLNERGDKSYLNKSIETVSGLFKGWLY